MKTKLVRPVLVESKAESHLQIKEGKLYYSDKLFCANNTDMPEIGFINPNRNQQLILISFEDEKIKVGDRCYCSIENRIIINLTTAQTINITLYFNSIVPTPTPTPTPTPSGTSGSLFGSGSLAIPSGVVLVSLTGQGGTGGSNPYDPGQEYIAPSGTYHPEVIEVAPIAPYLEWTVTASRSYWSSGPVTGPSIPAPTYLGQTVIAHVAYCVNDPDNMPFGEAGPWSIIEGDYEVVLNPGLPGVTGVAAYWDNPGQEYIAPSGGDYSGANTTATLNSVTNTWVGGFGGVGTSSTQTLTSTGLGQTLTYSVGAGGNLSYSYTL